MGFGNFTSQDAAPMAEINTTPLVDVMLVLLVVFIVTAPVMTHAIRVELPKTEAKPAAQPNKPLSLELAADGSLKENQRVLDAAQLAARLADVAKADTQTEVHLYADKSVTYERIAAAMAAAQNAGLTHIGLMTQEKH